MSGRGRSQRSLDLIEAAYNILAEIQPASVRAVCYRLFTMGIIASMVKSETNRVSGQLTWARETGCIPWEWIVDETREAERVSAFENPEEYIEGCQRWYRRDRWMDQLDRAEVWSEKGTIRGTLATVLDKYGVTFRVMHGHGSATAVHDAAVESVATEKPLTVSYIGDWDPSGMDMSERDLPRRLEAYGGRVHLQRVALDDQDVLHGNLPSFRADSKRGDPRYRWFVDQYGPTCWELDALSPVLLRQRVEDAIYNRLDLAAWQRAALVEAAEKASLSTILSAWPGISRQASKCSNGADR
jgi:hypothetical protein